MAQRRLRTSAALIIGALVVSALSLPVSGSAQAAPLAAAAATNPRDCRPTSAPRDPAAPPTVAPAPPGRYTPRDNTVLLNNPFGKRPAKRVITDALLNSVNSTPTCQSIRLATWNFRDETLANALVKAMERGVRVQVVLSALNYSEDRRNEAYNPTWNRFVTQVARINSWQNNQLDGKASRASLCFAACRYRGGGAHSKYYLFSKVGAASNVSFYGSHNLTDVAWQRQWNDLYVSTRPDLYGFMGQVFNESQPMSKLAAPWRRSRFFGPVRMDVYPYVGNGAKRGGDPVLATLNSIRCTNAGKVGVNGRTAIRISMAAMLNARSQALANRLVTLKRQGCNIRILVTNVGYKVLKTLQRNGVPIRQLARYDSRQKKYTYYTHTKFMTVNGNYGGKPNQQIVWNGTTNWTANSMVSDDLVGEVRSGAVVNRYNQFVNQWYARAPMGRTVIPTVLATEGRLASDPWSLVEKDY